MAVVLTRALVLPLAGVASVVNSRIVLQESGLAGFGLFSLLVSIASLIPISDFGVGGEVTNQLSLHGMKSEQFRSSLSGTLRFLIWVSLTAALVATAVAFLKGWSLVLGVPSRLGVDWPATFIVYAMCLNVPLGLGARILVAQNKQVFVTLLTAMNPLLSLFYIWSWISITNDARPFLLAILFFLATVTTSLIIFIRASKDIGGFIRSRDQSFNTVAPKERHKLRFPWAFVVLAVTLPLVFQSDRVIISHFLDAESIGLYSLVAVLFFPLNSIITVGQLPLWPSFLKLRDSPDALLKLYRRMSVLFGTLGLALGLALTLLGPMVVDFIAPHDSPGFTIFVAFGLILLVTGLNATPGMLLMDEEGRRVQATGSLGVLGLKIILGLWLVNVWGVPGIIFSTLAGLIVFQNIPTLIAATKRIRSLSQARA